MSKNVHDKEFAALNIATLAAYETLYGPASQELTAFIFSCIDGLDYFTPPERVIKLARQAGIVWLAKLHQKAEAQKAGSSADK